MADIQEAPPEETPAAGVQNLIDRIRDEGVEAGQQEAEKILQKARADAARIVAEAKTEAEKSLTEARKSIKTERHNAEEALRLAARDTIKELGTGVHAAFKRHVKRLVSNEFDDPELLRELILAVGARTTKEAIGDQAVEILLSESETHMGAPDADTPPPGEDRIHDFILGISSDMLREGVDLKLSADVEGGASVRLVDGHVQVDLTEDTISEFLLHHLLPRYRRILYHGD